MAHFGDGFTAGTKKTKSNHTSILKVTNGGSIGYDHDLGPMFSRDVNFEWIICGATSNYLFSKVYKIQSSMTCFDPEHQRIFRILVFP